MHEADPHAPPRTERSPLRKRVDLAARTAFWVLATCFTVLLTYNTLTLSGEYTVDSLFYVDTARNVLVGRGISQSMVELDILAANNSDLPMPMTHWAPAYPIAIAAVTAFGVPAPAAALAIASGAVFFVLLSAYLLMRRLYDASIALACAALLCHLPPLLLTAHFAWSETLGMCLILGALALALTEKKRPWRLLLAGVVAGAAIATRYAFLPLAGFLPLLLFDRKDWRASLRNMALTAAGIALIVVPLCLRNALRGQSLGGPRWGSGHTALQGLQHLGQTLATSFQAEGAFVRLVQIVLLSLALLAIVLAVLRKNMKSSFFETCLGSHRWVLLAWPALYMAFILYAQTRVAVGPIAHRLALPAIVVLYLAMAAFAMRLSKLPAAVTTALALVLVTLATLSQGVSARTVFGKSISYRYETAPYVARSETLTWLASHIGQNDLLLAEQGIDIPFSLGPIDTAFFPTLGRPMPLSYEQMLTWLDRDGRGCRYDRCYLIVRPKPGTPEEIAAVDGPFLADLLADRLEAYPRLTLLTELKDGVVFTVDACMEPSK